MSEIVKQTLSNGVRVLVEPITHVQSASVGLWCRTGSRHETDSEAGITHLIEHMLFKGTQTRSSKDIAEAIEGRGGVLNAFTDKEVTCYYARVLSNELEGTIDVLTDMMLHSILDPEELKREAGVVLEEIKQSQDEPSDHVHEVHLHNRWGNHPLGKPIIGTPESVAGFQPGDLRNYLARRYCGENVLLSVAGNVSPEAVLHATEKALEAIPRGVIDEPLSKPTSQVQQISISKDVEQIHFCIGTDGLSLYDEDLYTMAVLDGALGGSMSSRIFQEVREKRGLVYSIGSYTMNYSSGGVFTVYGGTSPTNFPQVLELVRAEFAKVRNDGLTSDEIDRTKRHLCGNIVLALESMNSRMTRQSRNELNHRRDVPIEETLAKIDAVDSNRIHALSERLLGEEKVSVTTIGPSEGVSGQGD